MKIAAFVCALACALLNSCAGYELRPALTITDEDGREITASVNIKPVIHSEPGDK